MIFLSDYLKQTFGEKLYKVPLDAGFTCPNRDGTSGRGGCIFCSGKGSGEFAGDRDICIKEQLAVGIEKIRQKHPEGSFIAYFQAFTNTYVDDRLREKYQNSGDGAVLEQIYEAAFAHPDVKVVSIATRPDCINGEIAALLGRLNRQKPVWVELGLQTIHQSTAKYIRRGYSLAAYDRAVTLLKEQGISQIITHVILGLPGETKEMMLETVRYIANAGTTGIKLQLLHVIAGTDLAGEYEAGNFETLTFTQYVEIARACLQELPQDMVVHRITGDGDKRTLIAPLWSTDKKKVLNAIRKTM